MGRKYKQRGYQEEEKRPEGRRVPRRSRREGPRSPRMTSFKGVFRCAMCGTNLPPSFTEITPASECPKCGADLHSCKNCVFFDPASRFECTQPIPERISPKDSKNFCDYFEARTSVDLRQRSGRAGGDDARKQFEALFKKKP